MLFMGFWLGGMLAGGIGMFIVTGEPDWLDYVTLVVGALIGLGFLLFSIRFEFFRPEDEPTIFDRRIARSTSFLAGYTQASTVCSSLGRSDSSLTTGT